MASRQCAFVATVPNMIPCLANTPREDENGRLTSFPGVEAKRHDPYHGMPSFASGPTGNSQVLLAQHPNLSPRRQRFAPLPAVNGSTSGLSSGTSKVNLAFHKINGQASNSSVLPWQIQNMPPAGGTIQAAPIPSQTVGMKVSRLPSNDVSRKAPLQGKSSSQDVSRKIQTPGHQRSTSRQDTPIRSTAAAQERCQSANEGHRNIVVHYPMRVQETEAGNKRKRDDLDQENELVEGENEGNAAEIGSGDQPHSEEEKRYAKCPRCKITTKKQPAQTNTSSQSKRSQSRRPLYEYEVPLELESIRKALGLDNWNEYVYLMESLWLNKMTAHEFQQGSKVLFRIDYAGVRKRMNGMIVRNMIMPRLEEVRSSLSQHKK